jgi:ribosomal protein S12 methylthiotransferase
MSTTAIRHVYFVSLGCAKNRVDTEAMLGQLLKTGYKVTPDPFKADAVIVNTCGFLQSAVDEALDEISGLAALKVNRSFTLAVSGCLVQRMGKELLKRIPQIDLLIGVHGYRDFVKRLDAGLSSMPAKPCQYSSQHYLGRALTTGPGWAYLRIADGCNNKCSYCLIPKIRGEYRSRSMEHIIAEAKVLVSKGVREINLIAQDTTNYGVDIYKRRALPQLLRKLERIEDLQWVRILYTHPAHYSNELIETITSSCKTIKYLDIPLQHTDPSILKSMNRKIGIEGIADLLCRLRSRISSLVLRTTFMVGFPGETDKRFRDLLSFVKEKRFDRVGAFAYSPEPGTKAAGLVGQVSKRVARKRLDRLMATQKSISRKLNENRVGSTCLVLVEGKTGKNAEIPQRKGYRFYGRSYAEAPEVDGRVYLKTSLMLTPGTFVTVRIDKAWDYDLGGVTVK